MRVAVLGAGGPAGVNVCRALAEAGHDVVGTDDSEEHLVWAERYCVEVRMPAKAAGLGVAVTHAQPEPLVAWTSWTSHTWFGPRPSVIRFCQDKYAAARCWRHYRLRSHDPMPIGLLADLFAAGDTFGYPFWLRAREGAGARGATLVENAGMGQNWIRYWQGRGVKWDWVAEEYLPGDDFCWTSLWKDGTLYAAFTRKRLEWIYPHLAPSGRTGTPSIAETVHRQDVNEQAEAAVRAVDWRPNGIYCVDLREDKAGVPRPTEINAGRWATTSPLYSELGVNLPDMHVRLAAGEQIEPLGADIYPEGIRLSRHIDCGHVFTQVPVAA